MLAKLLVDVVEELQLKRTFNFVFSADLILNRGVDFELSFNVDGGRFELGSCLRT